MSSDFKAAWKGEKQWMSLLGLCYEDCGTRRERDDARMAWASMGCLFFLELTLTGTAEHSSAI